MFMVSTACLFLACSHIPSFSSSKLDRRPTSVLFVDLFDQRTGPSNSEYNWKGDWLFRRERLTLIDRALTVSKPDVALFQDLLAKRGSPSDSDKNILSKGALEGYEWQLVDERLFEDTGELSYHGFASSLPLRLLATPGQKYWPIGVDGGLSLAKVEIDGQPVLIFNLKMPTQSVQLDKWYQLVLDRILTEQKVHGVCADRLVLAGYIPGQPSWQEFQNLLNTLGLVDSATNFCLLAKDCFTETTANALYASVINTVENSRSIRVFWPQSSLVTSSQRVLDELRVSGSERSKRYGISTLTPTLRYGWLTQARLAKCE